MCEGVPRLKYSKDYRHTVLMTLVFPDSLANTPPRTAPLPHEVFASENGSVRLLPTTGNPLHSISRDTALAFSVYIDDAPSFLSGIQEIPIREQSETAETVHEGTASKPVRWIMKAANTREHPAKSSFAISAGSTWIGFVDLIKVHFLSECAFIATDGV